MLRSVFTIETRGAVQLKVFSRAKVKVIHSTRLPAFSKHVSTVRSVLENAHPLLDKTCGLKAPGRGIKRRQALFWDAAVAESMNKTSLKHGLGAKKFCCWSPCLSSTKLKRLNFVRPCALQGCRIFLTATCSM